MKRNKDKYFIILIILFELLFYLLEDQIKYNITLVVIPLLITITLLLLIYNNKHPDKNNYIYLILIYSIALKNIYVLKTSIYDRSYDILEIYDNGHLAYIYNLYKKNILPLTNEWQFYHPPLFHIIAALGLKINELLGFSLNKGIEGIQYINVVFSTLTIFTCYKIIDKIKIHNNFLIKLFMSVTPIYILFSGSINNDCLVTFLESLIILYLYKWDEMPTFKNTIILALITGFCVMTKYNGAIMAAPILFVFVSKLVKYIKNKNSKDLVTFFLKMLVFGIISLPIGLWYYIRSIIKFGLVKVPVPNDWLYVGNASILERFFDISFSQIFDKIYCNINGIDTNMFAYLVKSSLFEEFKYKIPNIISILLLSINIILIFISIFSILKYMFSKNKEKNLLLLFFVYIITIISYIIFNIKYPYFCSYDFRYIALTSFIGYCFISNYIELNKNKLIKYLVYFLTLIYSSLCVIFILMI